MWESVEVWIMLYWLYSVLYINQNSTNILFKRERKTWMLLFSQSITYINQHFEEAAAEEGNERPKTAKNI